MCFTLAWLAQLLVDLVILCGVVAILKLLVPLLVTLLSPIMGSGAPIVGRIIEIVLYVVIAIFVIWIVFGLLECLVGGGSFHVGPFHALR